jgi:hypothetical protein
MTPDELPLGGHPPPLDYPHFPTRFQAVIWRNWELVSPARLAEVLGASEDNVSRAATALGLRAPPQVCSLWLSRGYATIIRANWHLLPYEQLLTLLGWAPEKMAYHLKEDDFLWHKLGDLKPRAEPVRWRALTPAETRRTAAIRRTVRRHFQNVDAPDRERPFQFLDTFSRPVRAAKLAAADRKFHPCFVYSYSAPYGDPLIDAASDPYPDGLLSRYADLGVDGVWLPVVLYKLTPRGPMPELAQGCRERLDNLNRLTDRAKRHGLGVYLYLNEPRCLPPAFFERSEEWRGVPTRDGLWRGLCTSVPAVQHHLREQAADVFRAAPGLAGAFTITMSENLTNCYSHADPTSCPRCAARRPAEVIAEVNGCMAEGVRSASPTAKVIVWNWGWKAAWEAEAIDRLPQGVHLMCTSEWGRPTRVGGIPGEVVDYSISQVGPSERSLKAWDRARRRGLGTIAKVQLNTSWECAPIPYLPVPDLVEEHLARLKQAGVDGLMLSWTLGGFPGGNLALLGRSSSELARRRCGARAAPAIQAAWATFSGAFREFPFACAVLYNAPHNAGPMNLLFARPTGFRASMVGFPYDDLERWRAAYPEDVFEAQLRALSERWKSGLDLLDRARALTVARRRGAVDEIRGVAEAAYCHFRSAYLQVSFVRRRARTVHPDARRELRAILDEEIALAKRLRALASADSRLGFEATNHYAYTLNDLMEKVLNGENIKRGLRNRRTRTRENRSAAAAARSCRDPGRCAGAASGFRPRRPVRAFHRQPPAQ